MEDAKPWQVIFSEGDHPLNPFLKEGFGHVWAVQWFHDYALVVHPAHNQMQVAAVSKSCALDALKDTHTHLWVLSEGKDRFRFCGPYSCVEVVKALLGISNPFILTPYQLYKRLLHEQISESVT